MNVLLIYPRYPDTFWSFKYALKFVSKKAAFPPLGLLTVAAMLPPEWNQKLIDMNVTDLDQESVDWADIVFISAMLVQKDSAQAAIALCKARGKRVVAGGPAFTAQQSLFPGIDHFVLNEAEVTLPLFLKDLALGHPKKVYRSDERPDITRTPVPLWSLINLSDYATMSLQYSRGCPHDCEFCDIVAMNGRKPRTKATGQMIAELQSLYDAGWRGIVFIVDDNFIGNTAKAKKMLSHLIDWQKKHRYPFRLLTEVTASLADDEELMQLMSIANFYKVFIGLETPCTESLQECGKIQNTSRNLAEAVRKIHQNGMQVMGGFIIGFDHDPDTIFETQIKFIQQIGVVTAMVGLLIALPQTRLWNRLKSEGRLTGDTNGENTDGSINFVPKMAKDKLLSGYKEVISTIYSPPNYYRRIELFIRQYRPTSRTIIRGEDLKAFISSIWNIGIVSPSRLLYWRLLIKTLLTKAKALPIAVELAIYGQHFERVARKVT